MKIKFNKDYLQMLAAFAAIKDVRYYLNGFHIKPHPEEEGVILTATDGHKLVTIHDETGYSDGDYIFPITKELLAASKKRFTENKLPLNEIQIVGNKAYVLFAEEGCEGFFESEEDDSVERIHHVEYIKDIEGRFPNTKRIFDKLEYKDVSTVCVNPSYIGQLVKICVNAKMPYINLMFCGVNSSIVAVSGLNKEIVAVIMPARGEEEPVPLPGFVYLGEDEPEPEEGKESKIEDLFHDNESKDHLYDEVVAYVREEQRVSISGVQRKFRIGYNRSANIVEQMEKEGVITAPAHNGAREVL